MAEVRIECLDTRIKFIILPQDCDEVDIFTCPKETTKVESEAGKIVFKDTETDEVIVKNDHTLSFLITEITNITGTDTDAILTVLDQCVVQNFIPPATYLDLTDTDNDYTGKFGYIPVVTPGEDGLVLTQIPLTGPYEEGNGTDSVQLIADGSNQTDADNSGILSGTNNTMTPTGSSHTIIIGGQNNDNRGGDYSMIGGGNGNSIITDTGNQGVHNTILQGQDNIINELQAQYATIINGRRVLIDRHGGTYFGGNGNFFGTDGSMQASITSLANITTDATTTDLFIDGRTNTHFEIPNDSACAFQIMIVGTQSAGGAGTIGDSAWAYFVHGVKRSGAAAAFVPPVSPAAIVSGADAGAAGWGLQITAGSAPDRIRVFVQGEVNKTIQWHATIKAIETRF